MENLKLKLFNFKNSLSLDQEDVARIIEGYVNNFTKFSEKEIVNSLNEQLSVYTFDNKVKSLVEGLSTELNENELLYDLKDLYKKVDRKNYGEIHRQPLQILLNIINESDEQMRMQKIVNELNLYDWIPEVKSFMLQFSSSPVDKENLKNGGNIEPVFTVVEKVEDGHAVFIKDKWFLLAEDNVSFCNLEDHIEDQVKLKQLRLLEQAIRVADVNKDRIDFHIKEDLTIGVDASNGKKIYLNDELMSEDSSLENVFSSPLVPFLKSDFYPIIRETSNNIDKFVEFDVAMRVSNVVNMHAESYIFNYKDKIFTYTCDKRYGNSLFEYESVMELIGEMKRDYDFDITYFYQNKLSEEVKSKRSLEDREREITIYLDEINENVDLVNAELSIMKGNDVLENALNKLLMEKAKGEKELLKIKKAKLELDGEKKFVNPNAVNENHDEEENHDEHEGDMEEAEETNELFNSKKKKEELEKAKQEFEKKLAEYKDKGFKVKEDVLRKKAEQNKYRGRLMGVKGQVIYKDGLTKMQKMAAGSSGQTVGESAEVSENMEGGSWKDYLYEAAGKFERNNPDGLDKLSVASSENLDDLGEDLMNLYNEAAMVIVEPNVYVDKHEANLEEYYEMQEKNDLTFVKNALKEGDFDERWNHVINLVQDYGY